MPKTRLNVSLYQDLADFAKVFAAENRTSVAEMVTQYLLPDHLGHDRLWQG